jgi:hypothetical protein
MKNELVLHCHIKHHYRKVPGRMLNIAEKGLGGCGKKDENML